MPQTATANYQALDASPSKRPDFVLVIAGSPTVYAVADDTYSLSAGAHDLSSTNGFTTIRKWASLPEISAAKMKGAFPEAGGFDIGDLKVELLDKYGASTTTRDLTDLLSRQAYLEGNQTGAEYVLNDTGGLSKTEQDITLVSTSGLVAGDVIHISQEAILVGTVNGDGVTLETCTRGYLLTNATQHETGVTVYGYLPNLIGRPCWLYKGYRDLPLTDWLEAWGGLITSAHRSEPGKVTVQARSTTWAMWGGSASGGAPFSLTGTIARSPSAGVRRLARVNLEQATQANGDYPDVTILTTSLSGDYRVQFAAEADYPTGLGDGHYMIRAGDALLGLCNPLLNEYAYDTGTYVDAEAVKGPGDTSPDVAIESADQLQLAWTNATFTTTAAPTGSDPIDLILQFLTSTGSGTNGDYDDFVKGIGLAIPAEQIDFDSFTDVQAEYDYGSLRVFFVFTESVDAKAFVEDELCKPFGWYIATGNDGRIRMVRPKNPRKLHFTDANNQFRVTHSADTNTVRQISLPGGVYTPTEAAAALQTLFRAACGASALTVAWNSSDGIFTIDTNTAATLTFTIADAWRTLGFTAGQGPLAELVGDAGVGIFSDSSTFGVQTVTKNDVLAGSVSVVPNAAARVGRVNFGCNYSWADDAFEYKVFSDAETENLSPFGESGPYEINSKGLLRSFAGNSKRVTPFGVRLPPATGCTGQLVDVSSSFGIDASDSFATLFCAMLFDRYRNAPLRFKCRLKWRFNTLEIGDVLDVTHDVDGALIDQELGRSYVSSRLFEVVSIRPIPASGCVEVELLGHREGG